MRVMWLPASCSERRPAAGLLPVSICQEMRRRKKESEGKRKQRGQEGEKRRWHAAEPQGEAWMMQASGLWKEKEGEESEGDRARGGEADMQATEKRGNTPTSVT